MHRQVEVDGRRIAVQVSGPACLPAVVFVSGVSDDGSVWDAVTAGMHSDVTVVSYDRPGLGGSDGLPEEHARRPHGFGDSASELHRLLEVAGVGSPRVLVGHSIGALIAYLYAVSWPDEVAGLVLVDAADPGLLADLEGTGADAPAGTLFDWGKGAIELGRARIPVVPGLVVSSAIGRWHRVRDPERYQPYTMAELDNRWHRWQKRLAAQLGAGLVIAVEAGHRVHVEAPGLVALAVDAIVKAARTGSAPVVPVAAAARAGGTLQVNTLQAT